MRRVAIAALLLLATPGAAPTRSVTDLGGRPVVVPAAPSRIADLWFAHNELLIMLGATAQIAATVDRPASSPWMFRVAPGLAHAVQLASPVPDAEALLAAGVDLVFVPNGSGADPVRRIGIPALAVGFTDAASLTRCLDLTADVLNTARAHDAAGRYEAYLAGTIREVRAVTDRIAPDRRPTVLHIQSLSPLEVDAGGTIVDDWIRLAGGRNAATGLSGNMKPVSLEQVVAWNPDVVILGGVAGAFDAAQADGLWRQVKAVRDGRIARNPAGVFAWDRYGSEYALQLRWAAKTLHPDLFRSTDMIALTRRFYADFFAYPLRADEAARILDALPPA